MFKLTWNKFLLIVALLLLGAFFAQLAYKRYSNSQMQNASYIATGPVDHVLVIDLTTEEEAPATTYNQADVILAVQMGVNPDQHADDLILSGDVLGFLRQYSNGTITLGDPLYKRLELFFLDQNNNLQVRYSSLSDAGIRAILLIKPRNQLFSLFGRHAYIVGEAVMADSTKRPIREVAILNTAASH